MHVLLQMLNKKQKSKLYTNAKQENIVYLKILTNSYNFFILNQCSLQLIYLQQKFVHPIMQKEKKGEIVFRELKSLLVATILNIKNLGSTICSLCSSFTRLLQYKRVAQRQHCFGSSQRTSYYKFSLFCLVHKLSLHKWLTLLIQVHLMHLSLFGIIHFPHLLNIILLFQSTFLSHHYYTFIQFLNLQYCSFPFILYLLYMPVFQNGLSTKLVYCLLDSSHTYMIAKVNELCRKFFHYLYGNCVIMVHFGFRDSRNSYF